MLTKVKDLMHTGEEVPVAYPDTLMLDAVLEISSKRLGVVVIVDENKEFSELLQMVM